MEPIIFDSYWTDNLAPLLENKSLWAGLVQGQKHKLFFSADWFRACLHWQDSSSKLKFWVASQDDTIIGIAALNFKKIRSRGITHTHVEWLKVPDSQFCGIVTSPHFEASLLKQLIHDLYNQSPTWDVLELYPCSHDHSFEDLKLLAHVQAASAHYYLDLSGTWEDYYASKSRRLKKSNNHLANRLKAQGNLSIEHIVNFNCYALEEVMSMITFISSRSWKAETKTTLDNQGPGQFLSSLTKSAAKSGNLSIWLLKLNQEVIAYEYQLQSEDSIYALRSDFDEKYRDFSPGSYLNWKILQASFDSDKALYFMGPGVNPYKTRWKNNEIPLMKLKAYAKTLKGRLLYSINENLIPRVKTQKVQNKVEDLK